MSNKEHNTDDHTHEDYEEKKKHQKLVIVTYLKMIKAVVTAILVIVVLISLSSMLFKIATRYTYRHSHEALVKETVKKTVREELYRLLKYNSQHNRREKNDYNDHFKYQRSENNEPVTDDELSRLIKENMSESLKH